MCETCKTAITSHKTTGDPDTEAKSLTEEQIIEHLRKSKRARDYLATHNNHATDTRASSIVLISDADETIAPQDPTEVQDLRDVLREHARAAYELGPPKDNPHRRKDAANPESDSHISAVCSMCRGQCCHPGLDKHAFLEAEPMRAPLHDRPEMSADDILQFYMSYLPESRIVGSCLYHAAQGCTLPRWARADLCGSYLCDNAKDFLKDDHGLCSKHVQLIVADGKDGPTDAILHARTGNTRTCVSRIKG